MLLLYEIISSKNISTVMSNNNHLNTPSSQICLQVAHNTRGICSVCLMVRHLHLNSDNTVADNVITCSTLGNAVLDNESIMWDYPSSVFPQSNISLHDVTVDDPMQTVEKDSCALRNPSND